MKFPQRFTAFVPAMLAAVLSASILGGCVSKSKADAQARMAYMSGRQAGYAEAQQQQARGPGVSFIGPVQNPFVKWREGLTLTQAIVRAVYIGPKDPASIIIHRDGQTIPVDPKELLNGGDVPVEAGDTVELK